MTTHIKPLADRIDPSHKDIFSTDRFTYDTATDTFACPAQETVKRRAMIGGWTIYAMKAPICRACHLKEQCAKNKTGRTVRRHIHHDILTTMYMIGRSRKAKRDIGNRRHLMERSFPQGVYFGMKRAWWRRLWRVQIRGYLIAGAQSIRILMKATKDRFTPDAETRGEGLVLPGHVGQQALILRTALRYAVWTSLWVPNAVAGLAQVGSFLFHKHRLLMIILRKIERKGEVQKPRPLIRLHIILSLFVAAPL